MRWRIVNYAESEFYRTILILFMLGFGSISDVLRGVDVPIISNDECAQTYGVFITDNIICNSGAGGKGTCNVSI